MPHTKRFKPSKELIQITKRRMDEAMVIIKNLEQRLAATTSTTEKQAILDKLAEIKKVYDGYIGQLQCEEEAKGECLPRVAEPKIVDLKEELAKTKQEPCEYKPTGSQEKKRQLPVAVTQGEQVLQRRAELQKGMKESPSMEAKRWSDIQKQNAADAEAREAAKAAERQAAVIKYREELAKQVQEEQIPLKTEQLKNRPPSPKIYESTFKNVGQVDLIRQQKLAEEKKKLNEIMAKEVEEEAKRRQQAKLERKTEVQIDLSRGILPVDKIDSTGNIKKTAVPEGFLVGEYSNQAKQAPVRESLVDVHKRKQQQELEEIAREEEIKKAEAERKRVEEEKKLKKIEAFQKQTTVAIDVNQTNRLKTTVERNGSLKVIDDDTAVHGNFYKNMNRRINKQPDAKQDVIFGENNFITKMDEADRRRVANKPKMDIEEEERLDKIYAKNPQKKPLDELDVKIFKNYIEAARDEHNFKVTMKEKQKDYHSDLEKFEAAKRAEDPDELVEREKMMMVAPKMVHPPF